MAYAIDSRPCIHTPTSILLSLSAMNSNTNTKEATNKVADKPVEFTNEQERWLLERLYLETKFHKTWGKVESIRFRNRAYSDNLSEYLHPFPFDVHMMEQMVARGHYTAKDCKMNYKFKILIGKAHNHLLSCLALNSRTQNSNSVIHLVHLMPFSTPVQVISCYCSLALLPIQYDSYDIHNRLLQADTTNLLHKNAPHVGDRCVIVLFNKDLCYKGTDVCQRSTAIRNAEPLAHRQYITTHESEEVKRARHALLDLLNTMKMHSQLNGDDQQIQQSGCHNGQAR